MTTKIKSSNFNTPVSVNISGGTIENTIIGANTAAAGTFTNLNVNTDLFVSDKIIHSGDTNTSIRFPANDTLTVETNGVERLRVASSGNVGLGGVTDPTSTLHVNGTVEGTFLADKITAEAGTDNTRLMTPLRVGEHMIANQFFSRGQTFKLVTYAANTWYQNTTGKPIYLNVRSNGTSGSHTFLYGPTTTEFNTGSIGDGSSGTWNTLSLVWQPDYFLQLQFAISASSFSWEIS
jgi:hypothetical protein